MLLQQSQVGRDRAGEKAVSQDFIVKDSQVYTEAVFWSGLAGSALLGYAYQRPGPLRG